MKSRWVEEEAAQIAGEVGLCAYASRLLGAETSLVLAGGGNSSVRTTEHDVFGDEVEVLHVKGSGWDMAGLEPGGMALGKGIYILEGHSRVLRHELVHVAQYQQLGGIGPFMRRYLVECLTHGYADAPLEVEAREKE